MEAADAEDADVVVVGSHGRGPVGRLLLGSVSSYVVEHAGARVLVVRPDQSLEDVTDPGHAFDHGDRTIETRQRAGRRSQAPVQASRTTGHMAPCKRRSGPCQPGCDQTAL